MIREGLERGLRRHVARLAGEIGERNVFRPSALDAARCYIEAEWQEQNYAVAAQWYEAEGVRCANLAVTREGAVWPDDILLIGAHYDSVLGSPGANDNASGVAALIEIASAFAAVKPALSVRFVAFVNEEPPFFPNGQQGSMVYARAARARGDRIRFMISLETIGFYSDKPGSQFYPPMFRHFYPDCGNFIGFVADFRSRRLMRRAAAAFRHLSDFPLQHVATLRFIPGVSWSDHRAFWAHGYRAMMVTDTAFYRYPYYHDVNDTPDKLTYERLSRMTAGLCDTLAALAGAGEWSLLSG
jgi:hypothetical protein